MPDTTLYHFCAAHMKPGILREGVTLGEFLAIDGTSIVRIPGVQWLTVEPDPQKQSWATRRLVKYSRTAYRLTVRIPWSYRKKLVRAIDYVSGLPDYCQKIVTDWPGSDKWYVYTGRIPPKWIVGCRVMEDAHEPR